MGDQDNFTINLALDNELEEVVVTSLGIKREAKALGYAVQKYQAMKLLTLEAIMPLMHLLEKPQVFKSHARLVLLVVDPES